MTDELEDLPGVGPATAEKLREAGYERYEKLATADASNLSSEADIGDSTAEDIVQAAKEEADIGGFSTSKEMLEDREEIGKISTLIPAVDDLLVAEGEDEETGGIETQSISEIYGAFGSGKSQFTHQMAVNVQIPEDYGGLNGRAIFIDSEDSFRPSRIREMVHGLDDEILQACMDRDLGGGSIEDDDDLEELTDMFLDRVHVAKAYNSNHQILLAEKAEEIAEEHFDSDFPVKLVVVDSLTAHFRSEYVGRGQLAKRQQKLNQHLHDIQQIANLHNAAALITNQVTDNPDSFFGDPTKPIGGNILGHNSNYRFYIKNSKGNKRVIKLANSPNLPEGEAAVRIETEGLKPE